MLYFVRARPRIADLGRFRELLADRTIQNQEPDGNEIVASMKRAVIVGDRIEWYETCFCSPPLRHEKATFYDRYFTDMQIEPVRSTRRLRGESFWQPLKGRIHTLNGESPATQAVARTAHHLPITSRMT